MTDNVSLRDLIYTECKDYVVSNKIIGTYNISDKITWTKDRITLKNDITLDIDYDEFSVYTSWSGLRTFRYEYNKYGYDLDVSVIREGSYVMLYIKESEPYNYDKSQKISIYKIILNNGD